MNKSILSRGAIMAFLNATANPDQRGGTWPTFQIVAGDSPPVLTNEVYYRRLRPTTRKVIVVGIGWLQQRLTVELLALADITDPVE